MYIAPKILLWCFQDQIFIYKRKSHKVLILSIMLNHIIILLGI